MICTFFPQYIAGLPTQLFKQRVISVDRIDITGYPGTLVRTDWVVLDPETAHYPTA